MEVYSNEVCKASSRVQGCKVVVNSVERAMGFGKVVIAVEKPMGFVAEETCLGCSEKSGLYKHQHFYSFGPPSSRGIHPCFKTTHLAQTENLLIG